ncbi:salt tolerance down-regulator-domain-containing protein [Parasitella parasitica]|nr:salt tolerance down-regulator-domain-containing protein [Parasitella parasitica]
MTKSMQLLSKPTQSPNTSATTPSSIPSNDMSSNCTASSASKKKKKYKKKSKQKVADFAAKTQADMVDAMMNHHVIRHGDHLNTQPASSSSSNNNTKSDEDNFWSITNNTEERQKIREFWLQLGEDERRSLVKVEKDAVLRKMKEQQKHNCNCSVCGKRRAAIEDELEVLYDAYYEELEQYANHQRQTRDPLDEEDDDEEDEDDEDLDDEDLDDEDDDEDDNDDDDDDDDDDEDDDEEDEEDEDFEDADDDDEIITRPPIATYAERSRFEEMAHIRHTALSRASANGDHFSFGNSLTVKGGILTVADDLLKNDGRKFLDMMERLAARRMQKEDNITYLANNYLQEEEGDEDAFDDDDDEDPRTEEQRMEEGRRMFQIFAARMFEQRVLAAYREKVAQERQQRLLEELEEEDRLREEREAKKQIEREKKKDKKRQLKQQQETERLAREAKKKAEEEAAKREKQKKNEIVRQKREQERLKKEAEKRQREEERLRKEEEKKRRIKEEKDRAAERERKRKEKEETERIAKENIQKAKEEKEQKERLEEEKAQKMKAEKEENDRLEREKAHKIKAKKEEKECLKQEATVKLKAQANVAEPELHVAPSPARIVKLTDTVASKTNKTPSPPPGIIAPTATSIDDSADRQQVLIDVLVGSGRPSFVEPNAASINTTPIRPPPHLQHPSFLPSHLDILQGTSLSSSLLNASPIDHPAPSTLSDNSPSIMGMFNNRITSPLEPSSSSRRSITPIAPIGQPTNGRRVSSIPIGSSPLHDAPSDPIITASNAVKRPSVASPFDSTEPKSFFSSFLFGEPRNNMTPVNDYDTRFAQQPTFDRRFSSEPISQPIQPNWTNGWTPTSVLSDNAHGKLFGDAPPDCPSVTLERAKVAYQKLNEITQTNIFRGSQQYHTLVQLHCMMNDLYGDFLVDIRELYEVLLGSPLSGFQCLNHAQHGMVVLYDPMMLRNTAVQQQPQHPPPLPLNNSPPAAIDISPFSHSNPTHPLQHHQHMNNATSLFSSNNL